METDFWNDDVGKEMIYSFYEKGPVIPIEDEKVEDLHNR